MPLRDPHTACGLTYPLTPRATDRPTYRPPQVVVARGLRILLGLLTGADASAVRLALSTLQGTLLMATGQERVLSIRPWVHAALHCSAATGATHAQGATSFEPQEVDLFLSLARSSTRVAAMAASGGGEGWGGDGRGRLAAWWDTRLWDSS